LPISQNVCPQERCALAAASIVRSLETSLRRGLLSQHYREVAALPPDDADTLLDLCEEPPTMRQFGISTA